MASEQNGKLEIAKSGKAGLPADRSSRTPWIGLAIPLLIAFAVLFFSPNFKSIEGIRNGSLGGDFLQEWVGGYIAGSGESDRIYDLEYFRSIQHDPKIVGFEWPDEKYFPAVYPPFFYQMMQPFSAMSYPVASRVWLFISAVAISLSAWLLFRFFAPARKLISIGLFGLVTFVPVLTCLVMGQKSAFLLLILTGSFLLLHHEKPLTAGLLFGLIAFKPHLGLVIGLVMLAKRQWQFAGGAMLTVALMVGVSYWVSPKLWSDYFEVAMGMNNYVESGGYQLTDSHSLWGAVQLALSNFAPPGWLVKLVTVLLMAAVAWLLIRIVRGPLRTGSGRFANQYAAMVIAMVMLSPHFYSYDLTILLLPIALLATSFFSTGSRGQSMSIRSWLLLALFILPGLFPTISSAINLQFSIFFLVGLLFLIPESEAA